MRSTIVLPSVCALAVLASARDARALAPSLPLAPRHAVHREMDVARDSVRADSGSAHVVARTDSSGRAHPMTFGAWFGAAERSPTGAFGRVPERALRLLAFRVGWTISRTRHAALDYQIDVVPLARISGPRLRSVHQGCVGGPRACEAEWAIADDHAVYGAGASPIGLQLRGRPGKLVQPFAAMSGGMLVFSRPVPVDDAQRFNFTGEAGVGAIVGRAGKLGAIVGYKFHHLSNGGLGAVNPGLDGNVIYVGVLRVPR